MCHKDIGTTMRYTHEVPSALLETLGKITNERYRLIHTGLVLIHKKFLSSKTAKKHQQQLVTTPQPSEIHPRLFASLPFGLCSAIREVRHRLTTRTSL